MKRSVRSSLQTDCHVGEKKRKISLIGHCVICLRKVETRRKGPVTCGDGKDDDEFSESEIALNSTVTAPGFLETFKDIWSVLENRVKDKHERSVGSEGITVETVVMQMKRSRKKNDEASASETLTFCQFCCGKVVGVENLMKAVRQQVREISMLVKESRRKGGRLDKFEKALRDIILEADVIKATLDFVRILDSSDDVSRDEDNTMEAELTVVNVENEVSMECDDGGKMNATEADEEDDVRSNGSRVDNDSDSDYIKSEEDDDDDDDDVVEITSGEEEEIALENKLACSDKIDPLAYPEPRAMSKAIRRKPAKSVIVVVQEGSSSKTLVCDMEGQSMPKQTFRSTRGTKLVHQEQTCDMCGEIVQLAQIFRHLSSHVGAKFVVKCPNNKCPCMFTNAIGLRTHFKRYIGCRKVAQDRKFGLSCENCRFKTDSRFSLRKHLDFIHEKVGGSSSEKKWKCPVTGCGKRFSVKQSVYFHLEVHRNENRKLSWQKCDKCRENIEVEKMEGHLRTSHNIQEVIGCKQCPFKFSERDTVVEHLYDHRKIGILCDFCNGKYSSYVEFREHYFGEHQLCPKKYKCEEADCGALFWKKYDTISHKMKCHSGTFVEKTFKCEICVDVSFKVEYSLKSHKIRVHGAEPFKCEICGEGFTSKSKLYVHLKGHQGVEVNKFECKVEGCGMVFKVKKSFKRHVDIVHNGVEKEAHVCEECGKSYSEKKALQLHQDRVHLGEKLWVCDECGENFAGENILKSHRLIHTGERPFVCEICGQRFRQKVVLRTHLKGHEKKGKDFKPNGPMKGIRKRKGQQDSV